MSRHTFVDDYLAGVVAADAVDDYVDRWHAGEGDGTLPQFLGFTEDEYSSWVETPDALDGILGKYRRAGSTASNNGEESIEKVRP
jgi:hypothetical protein